MRGRSHGHQTDPLPAMKQDVWSGANDEPQGRTQGGTPTPPPREVFAAFYFYFIFILLFSYHFQNEVAGIRGEKSGVGWFGPCLGTHLLEAPLSTSNHFHKTTPLVTHMQKGTNIVSMKLIIMNISSSKFVFSGHFWEY